MGRVWVYLQELGQNELGQIVLEVLCVGLSWIKWNDKTFTKIVFRVHWEKSLLPINIWKFVYNYLQ